MLTLEEVLRRGIIVILQATLAVRLLIREQCSIVNNSEFGKDKRIKGKLETER